MIKLYLNNTRPVLISVTKRNCWNGANFFLFFLSQHVDVQRSDILTDRLVAFFYWLRGPAHHVHVQKEGAIQSNRAEHDEDEISRGDRGGGGGNRVCHFSGFTKKPCVKGAIWDAGAWEAL